MRGCVDRTRASRRGRLAAARPSPWGRRKVPGPNPKSQYCSDCWGKSKSVRHVAPASGCPILRTRECLRGAESWCYAIHERSRVGSGRHVTLRLHRALRAAQAPVHLQDAASGARPEGQVRIRRAFPAAQQGERGPIHRLPGPAPGRAASTLPERLPRGPHGDRVCGHGHQPPACLRAAVQLLHAEPRVRLRQRARQDTHKILPNNEWRVRAVARLGRPRASGRRRMPGVLRRPSGRRRRPPQRTNRTLQPKTKGVRGQTERLPLAGQGGPRPRAEDGQQPARISTPRPPRRPRVFALSRTPKARTPPASRTPSHPTLAPTRPQSRQLQIH